MAFRWWTNGGRTSRMLAWKFCDIQRWPVLLRNRITVWFYRGSRQLSLTPYPPPPPQTTENWPCFWSLMSQHIRFWIHFVRVAFTSTKDTASPYIFKRSFVSMPIHLLVLFLLFIMSNLFYRRGGGAGGFQFVYFKRS